MIVIGADTRKGSHALAAIDEGTGRVRGSCEIRADDAGHLAAVRWARGLDEERVWAIEDCRHVSRRFEQALLAAGERVVRVAPHRMGASRKGQREPGKSDQIDALAVARAVVKDGVESFPVAYLNERAMEIRLLLDHRHDLVADRTRTVNRLRWHLLELCPELERSLKRGALNEVRMLDRVDRRLRALTASARIRIARDQIAQLRSINRRIEQLQAELLELVTAHRPKLLAEQGCGAVTAAILIGHTAGQRPERVGGHHQQLGENGLSSPFGGDSAVMGGRKSRLWADRSIELCRQAGFSAGQDTPHARRSTSAWESTTAAERTVLCCFGRDDAAQLSASLSSQMLRNQQLERQLAMSREPQRDGQDELAASRRENTEFKRRVAHEARARDEAVAAAKASARAAEASAQAATSVAARGVADEQARAQEHSAQPTANAADAAGGRPGAGAPRATAGSPRSWTSRSWTPPSMSSVGERVVHLGDFRRRRQSRQQASAPEVDFTWETSEREPRPSPGLEPTPRRCAVVWHEIKDSALRMSFALCVSLLAVAALTCVGAVLAVLRHGLPALVAGPLAAVSITSVALAAICHVLHEGLRGRRDTLASGICAIGGLVALIESYIAVRHHTTRWHLTQGELAAVGMTLLLLSLLVGVRGTQPVRALLLILTLVAVVPVGPLVNPGAGRVRTLARGKPIPR